MSTLPDPPRSEDNRADWDARDQAEKAKAKRSARAARMVVGGIVTLALGGVGVLALSLGDKPAQTTTDQIVHLMTKDQGCIVFTTARDVGSKAEAEATKALFAKYADHAGLPAGYEIRSHAEGVATIQVHGTTAYHVVGAAQVCQTTPVPATP